MIAEGGGCSHIEAVETVRPPAARVCEECVKMRSRRVHLRTCHTCGGTRFCDSSPNRHASKHARSSGHPVIASAEEAICGGSQQSEFGLLLGCGMKFVQRAQSGGTAENKNV